MKTFPHSQFEEMEVQLVKNITNALTMSGALELTDRQYDLVVRVVDETMTQSLLAAGYSLPWVRQRRN